MDAIIVGIDLGTTYSEIAYVDENGVPQCIPNVDGKLATPSVVLIEGGRIEVGDIALNQWKTNEEHVVRWIKRAMGNPEYRFQGMSPVEISAEILKVLKVDAERYLGTPVHEAVITCPAYFAAIEIENTKLAGEMAGFTVKEIVKEPVAAAVYYGIRHMRDGEKILVCDLGGGTFDATVLKLEKGVFEPLATRGDRQLGGHDWTMGLVEMVAERFRQQFGEDILNDLVAGQMLYEACETAKRDLSRLPQVSIPCHYRGKIEQIPVTREELESATEWRIQAVVMWAEEAVKKASLTWQDIDRILLVGGSSRLRRMEPALAERSHRQVVQCDKPDLAIALGAAIMARGEVRSRPGGITDRIIYKRTLARSLGTRTIVFDGNKPRITNTLLIPHGTETPVTRSRDDLEIVANGPEYFNVPAVEFEDDDDYDLIGNFRFRCLPNAKRGDRIRITFDYDISGIPTIQALDVKSGQPLQGDRTPYQDPNLEEIKYVRIQPRCVVFALDTSYSMEGYKLSQAKQALLDVARQLLETNGENCKIGVVYFSSFARVACHPTSDLHTIERAVERLEASGSTWMDDGINEAMRMVLTAPSDADKDIVMVTDGMPDSNRRDNTLQVASQVVSRGITLSSVGLNSPSVDLDFLKRLTPHALKIDRPEELGQAMVELLRSSAEARGRGITDRSIPGGLREVKL